MSNIYSIFAAFHFILINCIALYRCNGSNNLKKIKVCLIRRHFFLLK